jgi:N-acetylglutamate synthase-like GNAT family acetyltransferase
MICKLIEHNSPEYNQMVALRMEVLRKPLGLTFTSEQLEAEKTDFLIAAYDEQNLVGCCVLTPRNNKTIQLRQMAVSPYIQGKGLGRGIVAYAEELALTNGFEELMMHARDTALHFYQKQGYRIEGDVFIEVGIGHHRMIKLLNQ